MKLVSPITTEALLSLLRTYAPHVTHLRVLKSGGKRASCLVLAEVDLPSFIPAEFAFIELGTRAAGLPFEPLDLANITPAAPSKTEPASAPAAEAKPRESSGPTRKLVPGLTARVDQIATLQRQRSQVRNYTAFMDSLLLDLELDAGQPVEIEGYLRSKHTVPQALKLVLKRYPQKNPASVKRILKVRPRHLEKMKTLGAFDDAKASTRAPRWSWVGPGSGVEFVARIRKLLLEANRTPEKAAELACREFGRELSDGLRIARKSMSVIRAERGDAGPSGKERKAAKTAAATALREKNRKHRAAALARV